MVANIWESYKGRVLENISGKANDVLTIKDRLFADLLMYFFPLSLITCMPGIFMSLKFHLNVLALLEVVALLLVGILLFYKHITINVRKSLFIYIIHFIAVALLFFLGAMGPGLLYLCAGTFFAVLIWPCSYGFWSTGFIALFCIGIAFGLEFDLITTPLRGQYNVAAWVTVSCNAVIVSFLTVLLLPQLFSKLEKTNADLRNVNSRFLMILDATSDVIWDWNIADSKIEYNLGIQKMFGYGEGFLASSQKWWVENIHAEDRQRVMAEFAQAITDHLPVIQSEFRFRCADGNYKTVFNRSTIVRDERGYPARILGSLQDVTELRQFITQVERQNKTFHEIAWIQSHVVRAPLARLLGLIEIMKFRKDVDISEKELLDGIQLSAEELDGIIRSIAKKSEQHISVN